MHLWLPKRDDDAILNTVGPQRSQASIISVEFML